MFANAHQSGFLSIFYSVGSNPLALWDKQVKNGHIRRIIDDEVKSLVLDIGGTNVATTYITCPFQPRVSLGIKLPFLVMIIKNMKKYFSFEIQILDDKDMRRRFRVSNFQSSTKVRPFCTTMPIGLSSGWNQVQFNLADFTKRAYGSQYMETVRVQIHANVRIRRIYFTDQLHGDEDLPNEFKLFAPSSLNVAQKKTTPSRGRSKEAVLAAAEKTKEQEEEVPPPPTPAEETAREPEPEEAVAEALSEEHPPDEHPPEGEPPIELELQEGEAPPAEGAPAEGETPAEGDEAPPAESTGEPVAEGEAPPEGAEEVAQEGEAPPAEGEAAADSEVKEEAPLAEDQPEEPPAEAPAESEPPTESEPPSEPPTDTEPPTEDEE